jgi:hypothetical protein
VFFVGFSVGFWSVFGVLGVGFCGCFCWLFAWLWAVFALVVGADYFLSIFPLFLAF